MHVFADRSRRDDVVGALENQRRRGHVSQILPVVGHERHAREVRGDGRIGAAEAVRSAPRQAPVGRRCR